MSKPKVDIKYIDVDDDSGYLEIVINGSEEHRISVSFDSGNSAIFHREINSLVTKLYKSANKDGWSEAKSRLSEIIHWVQSP